MLYVRSNKGAIPPLQTRQLRECCRAKHWGGGGKPHGSPIMLLCVRHSEKARPLRTYIRTWIESRVASAIRSTSRGYMITWCTLRSAVESTQPCHVWDQPAKGCRSAAAPRLSVLSALPWSRTLSLTKCRRYGLARGGFRRGIGRRCSWLLCLRREGDRGSAEHEDAPRYRIQYRIQYGQVGLGGAVVPPRFLAATWSKRHISRDLPLTVLAF